MMITGGITALGRIFAGKIKVGQALARITHQGEVFPDRARYLYIHQGLERVEVEKRRSW